jgi:hypothetical protein
LARPTKLTPERARRIVDAIADCCTREAAAAAGGVSPSTLFAWLARGRAEPDTPEGRLLERVQLAELEAELTLTRDVRAAAREDWRAAVTLLERRHPDRWRRPTDQLEVRGRMELPDPEHARALADALREWQERTDE